MPSLGTVIPNHRRTSLGLKGRFGGLSLYFQINCSRCPSTVRLMTARRKADLFEPNSDKAKHSEAAVLLSLPQQFLKRGRAASCQVPTLLRVGTAYGVTIDGQQVVAIDRPICLSYRSDNHWDYRFPRSFQCVT